MSDTMKVRYPGKPTFGGATVRFFSQSLNYVDSDTRPQFWYPQLALFILNVVMLIPLVYFSTIPSKGSSFDATMLTAWLLYILFWFFMLVPLAASIVRRLRDAGLHPALAALWLVPTVGWLIVFALCLIPSKNQHNTPADPEYPTLT